MAHTVIALYRPKPGKADALLELCRTHVPKLREIGLALETPVVLLRSARDGTLLEIFDWRDDAAVDEAHEHPVVKEIWDEFGEVCEFLPLENLAEAKALFPHFERVA